MAMDLDDRITIAAPEGIELQLVLAGLGSRFIGGAIDLIVQGLLIVILAVVTVTTATSTTLVLVGFYVGLFLIAFAYPILFEVLGAGRTPGKRLAHTRVLRSSGSQVDLPASAIRNLMRLLDGLLLLWIPTIISIAGTSLNQRPGDLAAGTVVVLDRGQPKGRSQTVFSPAARVHPAVPGGEGWDVSAVTTDEVAAVRRFLERRESLDRDARRSLARRLRSGLAVKVTGAAVDIPDEQFLEQLVSAKASRG
jgi:uncharacterized RDD family membrane protein YckC